MSFASFPAVISPSAKAAEKAGRLRRESRADSERLQAGKREEACVIDHEGPTMINRLSGPQGFHHVNRFFEPLVTNILGWPRVARNVLVQVLARSDSEPKPPGIHFQQRRDCLCNDGGVITLARRIDDAERQVRRFQRRSKPTPSEPTFCSMFTPRIKNGRSRKPLQIRPLLHV
jgi:hypothetical protein